MAARSRSIVLKSEFDDDPQYYTDELVYYRNSGCDQGPPVIAAWGLQPNVTARVYSAKTMDDVEIDNFYARRDKGEVFFNPMSSVHTMWDWQPVVTNIIVYRDKYSAECGWYPYRIHEYLDRKDNFLSYLDATVGWLPPPISYLDNIDTLKDQAVSAAWANIDQSEIMSLVTVAEADKTLGTMTSLSKKALKILRTTRKRALKLIATSRGRKRLYRELSDLYLEARYGLRPLYYDLQGASRAYTALTSTKKRRDRQTFRGFRSDNGRQTDESSSIWMTGYSGSGNIYLDWNRTVDWQIKVRAGVLCKADLTATKVLGVDLIAQSAWELVPFSFIVDWFVNTSDIIGSWSPKSSTTMLGSWVTVKTTVTQSANLQSRLDSTPTSVDSLTASGGRYGSGSKTVITTTREPSPKRAIIPSFNVRLDPLKILDIGLIAQNLSSERRGYSDLTSRHKHLRF